VQLLGVVVSAWQLDAWFIWFREIALEINDLASEVYLTHLNGSKSCEQYNKLIRICADLGTAVSLPGTIGRHRGLVSTSST
jgi:hypothetical protein